MIYHINKNMNHKNRLECLRLLKNLGFNKNAMSDWRSGKTKSYMKHIDKIAAYFGVTIDALFALDDETRMERIQNMLSDRNIPVLIHPSAVVADSVSIAEGTVIMAGAVVNPDAVIGKGCIINTCSSVDHDCCIGDFVHVSVGAHIAGTVNIGDRTWIGIGAAVSNNLNICADCMIGAGAVVVKNIEDKGTYIGVPARIVK